MTAFSINYDLKQPGRDYSGLYDEIKRSEKWWYYLTVLKRLALEEQVGDNEDPEAVG